MNKKQIQQRVLQNGEPLDLDLFQWDEEVGVFSTTESNLVLDFKDIDSVSFITGSSCTFDTGSLCTFDTNSFCIFKTNFSCTFDTSSSCTFDAGEECVVVRRDVYEVIELKENQKIKLNDWRERGYEILDEKKTITIDGKDIEISEESFEELKKQLLK